MVSSRTKSSRTCPACGAHNSELSIFCAECGTGLNAGPWEDDGQTQAFQPAAPWNSWSTPADGKPTSGSDANVGAARSNDATGVGTPPVYPGSDSGHGEGATVESWTSWDQQDDRGSRGFVLGTLAWLLILAVFGVYLWSGVLSSGLKSDIRDLIPGLSTILPRM